MARTVPRPCQSGASLVKEPGQPVYDPRVAAERYRRLIEGISREFPRFRLVRKDRSRFQRAIHYGLCAITLGGMRSYLTSYQTTIGDTIYVTDDWDERDPDDRFVTLCHERIHLRQFRRYTVIGMAVLYLLVPLPMGLAYFRARFEKEAYAESIRRGAEVYGFEHVSAGDYRAHIVDQFLGPSYGWMWPFRGSIESWYDRVLASIEATIDPRPDRGQP